MLIIKLKFKIYQIQSNFYRNSDSIKSNKLKHL